MKIISDCIGKKLVKYQWKIQILEALNLATSVGIVLFEALRQNNV